MVHATPAYVWSLQEDFYLIVKGCCLNNDIRVIDLAHSNFIIEQVSHNDITKDHIRSRVPGDKTLCLELDREQISITQRATCYAHQRTGHVVFAV